MLDQKGLQPVSSWTIMIGIQGYICSIWKLNAVVNEHLGLEWEVFRENVRIRLCSYLLNTEDSNVCYCYKIRFCSVFSRNYVYFSIVPSLYVFMINCFDFCKTTRSFGKILTTNGKNKDVFFTLGKTNLQTRRLVVGQLYVIYTTVAY